MSGRRDLRLLALPMVVALAAIVGTITAALLALTGSGVACGIGGETAGAAGPAPTKTAVREIPKKFLAIYREAGSAIDISWPFLASIGYQECGHGTGNCFVVNPSGCAGPMEIAYVRGSACSPDPSVPTIWERFKTDGDGDGKTWIFDPADAVFTAAKILRESDGAPPAGGTFAEYHEAACDYYGACSDSAADYADEVMARAVEYGFGDDEVEAGAPVEEESTTGGRATESTVAERSGGASAGGAEEPPPASGPMCESSAVPSASANEIVRIAESQIGITEHPIGSNCQKYGPCEEWCALFVAWVWERAGLPLEGGPADRAYSGSFYSWVKQHGGRDLPPSAKPAPGDAVMYGTGVGGFRMEHVGIVERVFPNGEITTIEGNFADDVARVGPFDPAEAIAAGEPAAIFAFAEPPTLHPHEGGVSA